MIKQILTYPQTVKTKTGYMSLKDEMEVENFYFAGVMFVKQCLEECWKEKQEAEAKIRENY